MRQGLFYVFILILFSNFSLAQQDNYTFLYEQSFTKIGMKSWSAGGTGIVEPGLSGAALNNPACMRFNEITASAEFGRYFYTQSDFELSQNNIFIVPELVEVGMPYSNYNFEVGYANVYNYYSSYSLVGTHENGIVYFDFHSHVIEHSIFGSANMSEDQWSYGVTLGVNYLTDDEELFGVTANGHGFGMQAIAGVLFTPDEKQTLGLTVRYATPITYDLTYISEPYSYKAKSPWSVSAGYSRTLSQSIKALAGIEFQNWMDVTQNVRNKIQYHVGVVIDPSTTDELRFGLFTEIDPRTHIAANSGKYFLSGGYEKRVGNLKLGLSILDSHLFDLNPGENVWGTDVRETDISLGASYLIK